jgi:hypothetical protein
VVCTTAFAAALEDGWFLSLENALSIRAEEKKNSEPQPFPRDIFPSGILSSIKFPSLWLRQTAPFWADAIFGRDTYPGKSSAGCGKA